MFVTAIVLAVLLAFVYGFGGGQKFTGSKESRERAEHLRISPGLQRMIGTLEILAAIGLLAGLAVWPLGIMASAGLVLLMIGAVITHVRAGDGLPKFAPAIVLGVIALAELIVRASTA
jgi:DoxX-like family